MENNVKKVLLVLIIITLQSIDCHKEDNRLKLNNLSDKSIYFYEQYDYPDTTIPGFDPYLKEELFINKKSIEPLTVIDGTWEGEFENSPSGKLQIFLYDSAVLADTPWEEVREKYLILKRYTVTYQDLVDMNWVLEYRED